MAAQTKGSADSIGNILSVAGQALGIQGESRKILQAIAQFATPKDGGASDPANKTILNYEKARPQKCGYKFAALVLEFLRDRLRHDAIKDRKAFLSARKLCVSVLQQPRTMKPRYAAPPGSNPNSIAAIKDLSGTYVICRYDTGDTRVRQELLNLRSHGDDENSAYATYVSSAVVCRGMWSVMNNSLCCSMHGDREGYQRDIVSIHLARDRSAQSEGTAVLCGVLVGISSTELLPTVLPIIGFKLAATHVPGQLANIGMECDGELRQVFAQVKQDLKHADFIHEQLKVVLPQVGDVVVPNKVASAIHQYCPDKDPEHLVSPELLEFCKNFAPHKLESLYSVVSHAAAKPSRAGRRRRAG